LIYPEQDGMLITNGGQSKGVMFMINENTNSRHFFHLELAEKNKAVVPSMLETGIRSPLAQQYTLYVDKQQDQKILRKNILLLMIYTIDWPPIYPQETATGSWEF